MNTSKPPKPPTATSSQPNPTLSELVAIRGELKKLNQKILELDRDFVKAKHRAKLGSSDFFKENWSSLTIIALLATTLLTVLIVLTHQIPTNFLAIQDILTKPAEYEYQIVSPEDTSFEESMTQYGKSGWQVVSCRRAQDALDNVGYECIMIRKLN